MVDNNLTTGIGNKMDCIIEYQTAEHADNEAFGDLMREAAIVEAVRVLLSGETVVLGDGWHICRGDLVVELFDSGEFLHVVSSELIGNGRDWSSCKLSLDNCVEICARRLVERHI